MLAVFSLHRSTIETLRVTSGSIVCFEPTVSYDVQMMQGVKNVMFGGEGLFITKLEGPGRVWLQGMPADRMIAEIASRVPSGGPGIGIPIGMGGSSSGAEGAGEGTEAAAGDAGTAGIAASDAAIEGDRQATVASSGAMGAGEDVDGDSQSALYGDAVSGDSQNPASTGAGGEEATTPVDDFGDDASWANTSSNETTFADSADEAFASEEATLEDEGFFYDSTTTDGLSEGLGDAASEDSGGGGLLSTLWDMFFRDD